MAVWIGADLGDKPQGGDLKPSIRRQHPVLAAPKVA